ncbi:hypothetical protein [Methylocella sp. CPCC 101449]|uniref:hypothetical protein n=1 Tax=Methylocella sp. CPCC 101449 TaxID=2987531 RepID=UPI00288ED619|nr:hypothetical protein [Methylocella sp. CPCC 101449]MDT2024546.1 hypothetical protein [Methylocella sp. CPCC 101449]
MGESTLPVEFTVEATPDRNGAILGMVVEGEAILGIPMTAAQLDHLIELCGDARARLNDEVPERVDLTKPMRAIREANMVVGYEESCGQKAIAIRDPSYGWTQYIVSDHVAEKAGTVLLQNYKN